MEGRSGQGPETEGQQYSASQEAKLRITIPNVSPSPMDCARSQVNSWSKPCQKTGAWKLSAQGRVGRSEVLGSKAEQGQSKPGGWARGSEAEDG